MTLKRFLLSSMPARTTHGNLIISSAFFQVYEFMEPVLESLHGRAHGDTYVSEDETAEYTLGFAQVRLRT